METILFLIFLYYLSLVYVKCEFSILILHTNDLHSAFDEIDISGTDCKKEDKILGKCYGGFARLKTAIKNAKMEATKRNVASLHLNAGDSFQGTNYYTLLKWKVVADMVPYLDIDVMSLGNHEFDDGPEGLSPYLRNITIPVVCANINVTSEPMLNVPILVPSVVLNVKGKSIGIIGYLMTETQINADIGNTVVTDEIEAIKAESNRLKSSGVDFIIALGHSGVTKDIEIATKIDNVDLVVGGHSHTFMYTPKDNVPSNDVAYSDYPYMVTQESGKKVPVVQAFCRSKYLGRIELTFDDNGKLTNVSGQPQLMNSSIEKDELVQKALSKWTKLVDEPSSVVVGKTNVPLMYKDCYFKECNLGNLITDSYIDYVVRRYGGTGWSDSSIAIIQAGGIRSPLSDMGSNGNITYGDILTTMPFQNKLCKIGLTGDSLLMFLEYGVHSLSPSNINGGWNNEFLHVSGLRIVYNYSNDPGNRIVSIDVRCGKCDVPLYEPLDKEKTYVVLMSSFLATYGPYKEIQRKFLKFVNVTDTETISQYLNNHSPVYTGIDGRIQFQNNVSSYATIKKPKLFIMISFVLFNLIFSTNIQHFFNTLYKRVF